ncbi:DUF501 domain-containing protein [Persephonella atlantica]|uniref:DUF501 domain-containing protein n=1 Tax=Persephonella atlantica TaxID=2699429 RepID=A0ABS1GFN6_9AQUI|nr:DUF501 domain-containing protein [Persephonella atlantica]
MRSTEVYPVLFDRKKKIFVPQPTRFWILDKRLRSIISRLEEKGYIRYWEEKVTEEKDMFEFFIFLHEKEIKQREEILKGKNLPLYVVEKLTQTGIGGIEKFREKPFKVKCLHLWTAYHLGDDRFKNPIGEFVLKQVKKL